MKNQTFKYYPIEILYAQTGDKVEGFKFPANGVAYDVTNKADYENLQQFQIRFGINEVISNITDIIKTNKYYLPILQTLIEDYNTACINALSFASSFCWALIDSDNLDKGYENKLTPEEALINVKPVFKSFLLAIQARMEYIFPLELSDRIKRIEIE